MQKRSSTPRQRRPADVNQLAALIARQTTEQGDRPPDHTKDAFAVELGRRGGLKGGKARAKKLTPMQRQRIARKAAKARWAGRRRS